MGIVFELGAQPERISVVLFVIDLTMRHIFLFSAILGLISQVAAQDSWTQMTSPSGNGRHHPITVANDQYGYVLAGQAGFAALDLDDVHRYDSTSILETMGFSGGGEVRYGVRGDDALLDSDPMLPVI